MKFLISILLISALLVSCGGSKRTDAPTYGELNFGAEQGLQYITESEVSMFMYYYKEAKLAPQFLPEAKLMEEFLNDRLRMIISYRDFTEKEKSEMKARSVVPYTTVAGLEGMALIVPIGSADTAITVDQLKMLLTGQGDSAAALSKKWSEIVFDGKGSASVRYVDSLVGGRKLSASCFAKNSPQETIDYVAAHPNSIGLISFAMIADRDDLRVIETRKKVKTIAVSENGKDFFRPSQYSFFNFDYPLIRKIFLHSRDSDGSLAMGFISFISGQEGQLVIKQGGLMPARLEWLEVNASTEQINTGENQ